MALRDLVNNSMKEYLNFLSASDNLVYRVVSPTEIYVRERTPNATAIITITARRLSEWCSVDLVFGNSSISTMASNNIASPTVSMVAVKCNVDASFCKRQSFSIFCVDIQVKDGALCYSTSASEMEQIVIDLFDNAIDSVRDIPQVEQMVMAHLVWASSPVLDSVHKMEEHGMYMIWYFIVIFSR